MTHIQQLEQDYSNACQTIADLQVKYGTEAAKVNELKQEIERLKPKDQRYGIMQ